MSVRPTVVIAVVLIAALARCAFAASDEGSPDGDHISIVAALVDAEHREIVADYLSAEPKTATPSSTASLVVRNEINRIDRRKEVAVRASVLKVFGDVAASPTRSSRDRLFVMSRLGRLARNDGASTERIASLMRSLREDADADVRAMAERTLTQIDALPPRESARDALARLSALVAAGDLEQARTMFHWIRPGAPEDEFLSHFAAIETIVDSREILDVAIVIVRNGRDIDPICLIQLDGEWVICQKATEFTLPATTRENAISMLGAMDTLLAWYQSRKQEERRRLRGR